MDTLPIEIIVSVLLYLPTKDVISLQQLNKYWCDIINDSWVKKLFIHKELRKNFRRKYVLLNKYVFPDYHILNRVNVVLFRAPCGINSNIFKVNRLISIFELHLIIGQSCMLPPHKLSLTIRDYKYSEIKIIENMFYKLPNLKKINISARLIY